MTEQELKKLSRTDLLELLLEECHENDRLRAELKKANKKLADRTIELEESGSIAEAAMKLNGVFEAAEAAAAQYLENIRKRSEEGETVYRRIESEAREKAGSICAEADAYSQKARTEADAYSQKIRTEADEYSQKICTQADRYQRQIVQDIHALVKEQDNRSTLLHSDEEEQST